jgi:[FeFe] hydrogenase H-cluster maturation GTPase HydF
MTKTLNETPNANRLHIGFFGKRNSGKSSIINKITGQDVSIVSNIAGTTTDPVYKAMEINPIGPCVLIDTAGFDDVDDIGTMRVEKTKLARDKADIAVIVIADDDIEEEINWIKFFKNKNTPVLILINKTDVLQNANDISKKIADETKITPLQVSAKDGQGILKIKEELTKLIPEDYGSYDITGTLVREGDFVLLVMPQDIQAPKGRLILPQVQTIRNLLDKKCIVLSTTADKFEDALKTAKNPPKLIITDSQVFKKVFDKKPKESLLTSFSVLFAAYKGDITYYLESAKAIDNLNNNSKVLIAECCTHAPLSEDIGREKLPKMIRERYGKDIKIDIVSGSDFGNNLSDYDLIIQCGACMFNRKYVLSRIEKARKEKIPMTNYGVAIAYLSGILDFISI